MAEITREKEKEVKELVLKQKESPAIHENPTPEMLISQAIDRNVPIETMEKLMAMRKELKAEQAKEAFYRDLAQFQAECPVIKKNKAVMNKPSKGGGVRYHYAPLDDIVDQVKPYLQKFGFSYTIQTVFEKDPPAIISVLSVHHIEGHSRDSEFRVPIGSIEYMTEQQAHASASTFSKRYVFQNGFGILTGDEDNDAQGCDEKNNTPPKETPEQKYNKLEQEILALIDKRNISEEARKKAVDYINATYPDGRKIIHGIKNLEQLKQHIIELPEGEVQITPEDDAKLNDEEIFAGGVEGDDIQNVFQGKLIDIAGSEGNLSE